VSPSKKSKASRRPRRTNCQLTIIKAKPIGLGTGNAHVPTGRVTKVCSNGSCDAGDHKEINDGLETEDLDTTPFDSSQRQDTYFRDVPRSPQHEAKALLARGDEQA
jgi:hypothetical protein